MQHFAARLDKLLELLVLGWTEVEFPVGLDCPAHRGQTVYEAFSVNDILITFKEIMFVPLPDARPPEGLGCFSSTCSTIACCCVCHKAMRYLNASPPPFVLDFPSRSTRTPPFDTMTRCEPTLSMPATTSMYGRPRLRASGSMCRRASVA